jgi:hypothetical protein
VHQEKGEIRTASTQRQSTTKERARKAGFKEEVDIGCSWLVKGLLQCYLRLPAISQCYVPLAAVWKCNLPRRFKRNNGPEITSPSNLVTKQFQWLFVPGQGFAMLVSYVPRHMHR